MPASLRGALLLACALPSQVVCCRYLWRRKRCSELLAGCLLPLNLLPLLLAAGMEVRDAGGAGLVAGLAHIALLRQARLEGLRVI